MAGARYRGVDAWLARDPERGVALDLVHRGTAIQSAGDPLASSPLEWDALVAAAAERHRDFAQAHALLSQLSGEALLAFLRGLAGLEEVAAGRYRFDAFGVRGELLLAPEEAWIRELRVKSDPMSFAMEEPPATASRVTRSGHQWQDTDWMDQRIKRDPRREPLSVYEVHPGSWQRHEDGRRLSSQGPGGEGLFTFGARTFVAVRPHRPRPRRDRHANPSRCREDPQKTHPVCHSPAHRPIE